MRDRDNRDLLRKGAIAAGGAVLLGGCSGMLLANYTVSGMNDFYAREQRSAILASVPDQGAEVASRYPAFVQEAAARTMPDYPDYPEDTTLAATYREDGRY